MFVEKLIKENPELVKRAVRKICKIDEKIAEEYRDSKYACEVRIYSTGSGTFFIDRYYSSDDWTHRIKVRLEDFCISYTDDTEKGKIEFVECGFNVVKTEWMKFMYKLYGDKYIQAFIEFRNRGLKNCESRYKSAGKAIEKYKDETQNILAELGIELCKDEQTQNK